MQVLYGDGYTRMAAPNKYSYSFDGQSQSLDHVLANPAADEMVTGVDIWEINANETVFQQYSRFNYNIAPLYTEPVQRLRPQPGGRRHRRAGRRTTRRSSPRHQRLPRSPASNEPDRHRGRRAVLAGAVKQLRARTPTRSSLRPVT